MDGISFANAIATQLSELTALAESATAILRTVSGLTNHQKYEQIQASDIKLFILLSSLEQLVMFKNRQTYINVPEDRAAAGISLQQLYAVQQVCISAVGRLMTASVQHLQALDALILVKPSSDPAVHSASDCAAIVEELTEFIWLWEFATDRWKYLCWLVVRVVSERLSIPVSQQLQPQCPDALPWLLSFLRGGSTALYCLKLQGADQGTWQKGVEALLNPLVCRLEQISNVTPTDILDAVRTIPTSIIPTLCCIACELPPPPGRQSNLQQGPENILPQPNSDLIDNIVKSVSRILRTSSNARIHLHPDFISHALVETVQHALLACCSSVPIDPEVLRPNITTLDYMYQKIELCTSDESIIASKQHLAHLFSDNTACSSSVSNSRVFSRVGGSIRGRTNNVSDNSNQHSGGDVADQVPRFVITPHQPETSSSSTTCSAGDRRAVSPQSEGASTTDPLSTRSTTSPLQLLTALQSCHARCRDPSCLLSLNALIHTISVHITTVNFGYDEAPCMLALVRHCATRVRSSMLRERDGLLGWQDSSCTDMGQLQHLLLFLNQACAQTNQLLEIQQSMLYEKDTIVRINPAWNTFHAWRGMAGGSAVLEAVMRGWVDPPAMLVSAFASLEANLPLHVEQNSTPAWAAHISLAATLLKLLSMPSDHQYHTNSSNNSSHCISVLTCSLPVLSMERVQHALRMLLDTVRQHMLTAENEVRGGSLLANAQHAPSVILTQERVVGTNSSSSGSSRRRTGGRGGKRIPKGFPASAASNIEEESMQPPAHQGSLLSTAAAPTQTLARSASKGAKQLGAMLALMLARVTIWRVREGLSLHSLSEMQEHITFTAKELTAQDADLAGIADLLMQVSRSQRLLCDDAFIMKKEAQVWGSYARKHFHGRLLPGCSYLNCSNLTGASDAALPTLLCSGCRQVRYCSVGCQRRAWLEGGHRELCKT